MKHIILRSIAIATALLATVVNAGAQYNTEGGVATSKQVTGPDAQGNYTIRLETFATGTTTVTETATPVDVVLVLDVSGSMEEPKGTPTQLPRGTELSYNTVVNSDISYFYVDDYGDWDKIYAKTITYQGTRYYYLCYDYGQGETRIGYYTTDPDDTNFTSSRNAPLATASMSKMDALKDAVAGFIDEIEKNDHQDKNGNERKERLHNRISIISFSDAATRYCGLTRTEGNVATLKGYVENFSSKGGTNAGSGMSEANSVLLSANPEANKVVIMFTDGAPTDDYAAISTANTTKNDRKASVFSIGVFDEEPYTGGTVWSYMNYVSSNYPNATGINNPGTDGDPDAGFYQDASSSSADLTAIFKSIASGIGGSTEPIGSSTQVRDVVTNSFVLPNTTTAADVHVYTSAATGSATGADDEDPEGWATPVEVTSSVGVSIVNVDAKGDPTENAEEVKNKALFVTGFDYSKDDTSEGAGDGNWVGPRYKNGRWTWAGKKLIITFKVKADGEATGGESLTNTGNSGVYVQGEDGYTCVNHYEQPHTTLSVNIKIRKTGLRRGESATFELLRIRPKGYNPNGATLKDKVANLQYNIIGKPIPDTHPYSGSATQPDMSDYYEGMGWESFKKVILTNMREDAEGDGKEVVKDILALDPYWVYMVLEDDWGWAYTMSGDANQVGEDGTYTTSSVEVNPFRFHNTEEAGAVKHAEAIMINHFQSSESDAKVEHRKSSKVESF